MSADSPRRGSKCSGSVVRPEPVSDKSVMGSMVDFFQDVVSGKVHNAPKADDKEKIVWVRFEQADINSDASLISDPILDPILHGDVGPTGAPLSPLLLVIGYTNGVQIWVCPVSGEAQEVMSVRQGPVKILRLLPAPKEAFDRSDLYSLRRPLAAMCDATSAGQPYYCVKFVSLRTGDEVHNITFSHPVTDIKCNERLLVVAFSERIAAFDSCQFKQLFTITSCYPAPGRNPNPIALGSRWLAYADKKLVPVHQSCGGMTGDGGQSYAATVISAAKTLTKGLTMFGETVASSLTGMKPPAQPVKKEQVTLDQNGWRPGIVTIVDVHRIGEGQVLVQDDNEGEGLVSHFPAHASEPVTAMAFDPTGTMLLTVDRLGHNFHLFRIMAHPLSCSLGAVHHLYTLHRGDTTAAIQDISFSADSRWVAITTIRATTHVFPITPYGGAVNVRTHTSPRVVNRASRFHRSAGIEEMNPSSKQTPKESTLSSSPGSSPGHHHESYRTMMQHNNNNIHNSRLPPYPHPTTVFPLVQIKQTMSIPGIGTSGSTTKPVSQTQINQPPKTSVCVATYFARSRGWVAGSPNVSRDRSEDKKPVDSLYVMSWSGVLTEHVLDPRPKSGLEKVTEDSMLEVVEAPRAQWTLGRMMTSTEMRPPLPMNNPLLMGTDAIMHQKTSIDHPLFGDMGPRQESKESLSSDHSSSKEEDPSDQWLSHVEIITHAGPHRRLWMGPQFSFKTFQGSGCTTVLSANSSVMLSQSPECQNVTSMDLVSEEMDLQSLKISPARSSPVAMPGQRRRPRVSSSDNDKPSPGPTFIEAGSYDQHSLEAGSSLGWSPEVGIPVQGGSQEVCDDQLKEHLADAMHDLCPSTSSAKDVLLSRTRELDPDDLSSSAGSACSGHRLPSAFDARPSPPHSIEHVLVFPGGRGSPDLASS
ncbi:hypothetical protein CAPTEDRAFT_150615 [Capitella teleta]|uniref:BCAS3 microtubule associated cell migration factor n=1 Tax=Capitella teleta TaxID=283909 RepID=R7VBG7_CAPTE|nr:hypothetical protein CAPTEDRAFT_150615 [Capitella teleta]|eukprot:ELU13646.1 hypothetical protein CAPTEDRAFT_150615 [Capitella teleta]